jgi:hypothetical protein
MSYRTQALLANDAHLLARVAACAATQGVEGPERWAWEHNWKLSAEAGWDAAYAYAVASESPDPGNAEGAVTDAMILAAVQAHMATEVPPSE